MAEVLKKFGRYFLLDHVAQGGMAEIYRARLATYDGAGRLLVIKRIQPGYGANAEFVEMFKSEIKVTMGFSHPNIVQVYDFGEEQGQPYIAMEYVDGRNVRQLLNRYTELKQQFPIELAAYIIECAAAALHYAHSYRDQISGTPLNIVHRDISPQNILISYDGSVKIIDFGIAKATTNSESTRAGVIKGKPSYLSPEQINGEVLDGRTDIFALGTVFWEVLAGKKLFAGENDLAVFKMIESCNTHVQPPSKLNPKVPKELDHIVLRALAKQREQRYQTGEEMQRAIHRFMNLHNPDFSPLDLSKGIKELFKDAIVEDRKRIQKLNEKAEQLIEDDCVELSFPTSREDQKEDTTTMVGARENEKIFEAPKDKNRVEIDPTSLTQKKAVLSASKTRSGAYSRPAASPVVLKSSSKGSPFKRLVVGAAVAAAVIVLARQELAGFIPGLGSHESDNPVVDIKPKQPGFGGNRAQVRTILLKMNFSPAGTLSELTVNGTPVNPEKPQVEVPMDSLLEVTAERSGFRRFRREFAIESRQVGNQREYVMDADLEPIRFGYVNIRTTPSADATFMIDGKPWVRKTPMINEKVPVGTYNVKLSNDVIGLEKTIPITVLEGKVVTIDEQHLDVKE